MKVFIDTNIIISAMLFSKKKVSYAYYKCVMKHECYISESVVNEIKIVLSKKFNIQKKDIENFLDKTSQTIKIVKDCKKYNVFEEEIRDVKDRIIYRTAKASKCDAILTGDKDFLDNQKLDIKILSVNDII